MKLKHKIQKSDTECLKICLEIILTDELSGKNWDIKEHVVAIVDEPTKCKITEKVDCDGPCCQHLYYQSKLSQFSCGLKKRKMNENEIKEHILHGRSESFIMSVGTPNWKNHAIVVDATLNRILDPSIVKPCEFDSKMDLFDHLIAIYRPNWMYDGVDDNGNYKYHPTKEDEYLKYLLPLNNSGRKKIIEFITWLK